MPDEATDARQKAFQRLLKDSPADYAMATQDGREWIWRVNGHG
jgi:hypothetical protein